ncbi:MAG: hypothetical protein PHS09_03730 [Candidatus Omnitrophica bacterium]|nr:hypothetical protein [Candidatus Omnitrophota bacterium]MDD5512865.1 hypothetical protein [Candidatus Omnitrophota bacterium]
MLSRLRNRKAQSTLEYAILVAVVVAALITMRTYMKRGVQGKLQDASNEIGSQYASGTTTDQTTYTYSESADISKPEGGLIKSGAVSYSHQSSTGSSTGKPTEWYPGKMEDTNGFGYDNPAE